MKQSVDILGKAVATFMWWGRFLLLLGVLALGAWSVVSLSPIVADATVPPAEPQDSPPRYMGVASCASTPCHGGVGGPAEKRCEYTNWITNDPHAKAYGTLFSERSKRIAKNLAEDVASILPAHESPACLACHALIVPDEQQGPRFTLDDGVGCEACHGPSEHWLGPHRLNDWRTMSQSRKAAFGMVDLQSVSTRLRQCIGCHVGAADRVVDHDLIAAGHPRLVFEAGAFHANWPKHWDDEADKQRDSMAEARLWALGQVTSAAGFLSVLEHDAVRPARPWPDFAQYDCYACHHDLGDHAWRQGRVPPGAAISPLRWGDWNMPLLAELSGSGIAAPEGTFRTIDRLRRQMRRPIPDRGKVAGATSDAISLLRQWETIVAHAEFADGMAHRLARRIAEIGAGEERMNWEGATQRYLALVALDPRLEEMGRSVSASGESNPMVSLRTVLAFPDAFDSPRDFDPVAARRDFGRILDFLRSTGPQP